MTVMPDLSGVRSTALGIQVERATATLPASTTASLFSVDGGRVLLVGLVGEVTTVIQNQACTIQPLFDPDGTGTSTNLCTVSATIASAAVGSVYGPQSGTLVKSSNPYASTALKFANPWMVEAGDVAITTSATNTGSVKWTLWYVPIDSGATVTAV